MSSRLPVANGSVPRHGQPVGTPTAAMQDVIRSLEEGTRLTYVSFKKRPEPRMFRIKMETRQLLWSRNINFGTRAEGCCTYCITGVDKRHHKTNKSYIAQCCERPSFAVAILPGRFTVTTSPCTMVNRMFMYHGDMCPWLPHLHAPWLQIAVIPFSSVRWLCLFLMD